MINSLQGHSSLVNTLNFSRCGKYIFSGSDDMTLIVWHKNEGRIIYYIKEKDMILSTDVSPCGSYILVCTDTIARQYILKI